MTGSLGLFGVVAVAFFAAVADALPPKKIVAGTKAAPGEFPYMVSLKTNGVVFCGGAILGPRHILTAAHCIDDLTPDMYSDFYVATGSVFSNAGTEHVFSNVILHPDYDVEADDDVAHDLCIVVLAADIAFDDNQSSLDLPTALVPEGVLANLTGWGHPDEQTKVIAPELMKVNMKTLRTDSCNNYYIGHGTIRSDQICSYGGYGVGACMYDSGGPLVYKGQLVGVLAFGMACARGYPDVYTSVYHHVEWIKKTMKE